MIRLDNLVRVFGTVAAVDGLSLEIPWGELFVFLGPNGAGKTTTIRMITGLLRPTSGRVEVAGYDVFDQPVAARRSMAYVPDFPFVYDKLSPDEFVGLVGDLYRVDPAELASRRETLFESLGLQGYRYELLENLSHGTRQRVVIAAALVHDPRVIVIDEPMVGLDPKSARIVKDLLRRRSRAGSTVFLSTHQLAVAEELADRVGILHEGRLVAEGSPADMRERAGALESAFLELTR
jgi:ABC-2 type transport system ATP-binding protein